jgi:hypothetical protein
MSNYADMQTRIADEFVNEAITEGQIQNAIKSAIKHYEREPFWFNTRIITFSTVASTEFYESTNPDDFGNIVRIDSMMVASGSNKYRLRGVDNRHIDDVQDGTVTGEPEMYSRYANKIRLYPIPASVYTIQIDHVYKLAELAVDADENAWVDECEEMIRQAAKRILASDILHADDMAGRYAALEQVAYNRIRSENRLRQPQPELRANWPFNRQFYDSNRLY